MTLFLNTAKDSFVSKILEYNLKEYLKEYSEYILPGLVILVFACLVTYLLVTNYNLANKLRKFQFDMTVNRENEILSKETIRFLRLKDSLNRQIYCLETQKLKSEQQELASLLKEADEAQAQAQDKKTVDFLKIVTPALDVFLATGKIIPGSHIYENLRDEFIRMNDFIKVLEPFLNKPNSINSTEIQNLLEKTGYIVPAQSDLILFGLQDDITLENLENIFSDYKVKISEPCNGTATMSFPCKEDMRKVIRDWHGSMNDRPTYLDWGANVTVPVCTESDEDSESESEDDTEKDPDYVP